MIIELNRKQRRQALEDILDAADVDEVAQLARIAINHVEGTGNRDSLLRYAQMRLKPVKPKKPRPAKAVPAYKF